MTLQQFRKVLAFYARFTLSFTELGYQARRVTWSKTDPDFSGQHWLITGASGGLGGQIALTAARAGATVIVAARTPAKLLSFVTEAAESGITGIQPVACDFSLQSDTARVARDILSAGRPIDVLVNNVGILNDDHSLTREGHETTFVTNLLSHYVLTESLIRRGGFTQRRPLVINMTSGGGYNVPLSTAMLDVVEPARFNGTAAYGFHKRAQMALNEYWNRTYGPRGFSFYVMHPGWADTDGVKRALPRFRRILRPILRDAVSGSDTAIWLAANRPAQPADALWFDRKVRPTHVYSRTRNSPETPESLVAFLERELQKQPDALP